VLARPDECCGRQQRGGVGGAFEGIEGPFGLDPGEDLVDALETLVHR
jgi:hypothetical protein